MTWSIIGSMYCRRSHADVYSRPTLYLSPHHGHSHPLHSHPIPHTYRQGDDGTGAGSSTPALCYNPGQTPHSAVGGNSTAGGLGGLERFGSNGGITSSSDDISYLWSLESVLLQNEVSAVYVVCFHQ